MPIYQMYILVVGLAIVLIGGSIGYFYIQDSSIGEQPSVEKGEVSGVEDDTLSQGDKKSILERLITPFLKTSETEGTGGDTGTASQSGPPSGRVGETQYPPGGSQGGTSQSGPGSDNTSAQSGGGQSSGDSIPIQDEEKQSILESLSGSDSGSELSDAEKQSILDSLQ